MACVRPRMGEMPLAGPAAAHLACQFALACKSGCQALFAGAHFALLARPAAAAAPALAARSPDDVFQIVVAVIVGDLLMRLDPAQRTDEHAPAVSIGFRIRIA